MSCTSIYIIIITGYSHHPHPLYLRSTSRRWQDCKCISLLCVLRTCLMPRPSLVLALGCLHNPCIQICRNLCKYQGTYMVFYICSKFVKVALKNKNKNEVCIRRNSNKIPITVQIDPKLEHQLTRNLYTSPFLLIRPDYSLAPKF